MMTRDEKNKVFTAVTALSSVFLAYQLMGSVGIVLSVSILFVWSKW